MRERLARLADARAGEFGALPRYEEVKRAGYGCGFTRLDAFLLFAMVRDLKPRRLIEVGSGVSTLYAARAAERNAAEGTPCAIVCVDPFARPQVAALPAVEVVRREVQEVALEFFGRLAAGDVLLIDSTHVVKIDGDVPHLYLEVVPRLAPGVWIHSHDVHFPYNVPHPAEAYVLGAKWPMLWTEAMLLQAFLAFNREFELVLAPPLLRQFDEPFLARTLPDYRPLRADDFDSHFGSVWYRRRGAAPIRAAVAASRGRRA
jgi:hypothetical protein